MTHNFTQLNLLRNKDFYFINKNNKKIFFKVPTLEDFIADDTVQTFLSILNINWKALELNTKIDNIYELVLFMAFNGVQTDPIIETLHKFIDNLSIEPNGLFVDNEYITHEEFIFLTDCWQIAVGSKSLETKQPEAETAELTEIEKRIKASEEKIRKIKAQKEQAKENKLELDKAVITIIKEFRMNMEQVMQMNIFTILWYYSYALRYNAYRVETIAYGNGLIKKHHYFID